MIQWRLSRLSDDSNPNERWLEDEDDLKMTRTLRWPRWYKTEDLCWYILCRENTFLVKRECWCNCNFIMYSLVFLIYCNPMFILGCYHVMSHPDVPIGRINNLNKSCQVIFIFKSSSYGSGSSLDLDHRHWIILDLEHHWIIITRSGSSLLVIIICAISWFFSS